MKSTMAMCLVAALSGCLVGDETPWVGSEPDPTPLDRAGIVTSPRHGGLRDGGDLVVDGYYSTPGATVVIERWDDGKRAWVTAGTGTTSTTGVVEGGSSMYSFKTSASVLSATTPGGLLSLRARVGDTALPSLGAEAETQHCLDGRTTWHDRITDCASGASAITMIDNNQATPALAHRFLDNKGAITPNDTAAYYQTINAPTTLTAFLNKYQLNDAPTLTYYNLGDLATGREIRCKPQTTSAGTGVACTTFNYGIFGSELVDSLDLAVKGRASGIGTGSFANVSMVYDPPITAPNAVKFMVYNAAGALQTEAQLDTRGDNASIPNNCLNCHGSDSSYNAATRQVLGARFLPFDPSAFVFSDRAGMTRRDQEETMRTLNQTFLLAAPSEALADTVRGWYGGAQNLLGTADTSVVPAAWQGRENAAVYRNVIATTCRGCHASRSDALAFATPEQFRARGAQIIAAICGSASDAAHAMPSAEASLVRFWSGPERAYLAGFFGAEMVGTCAPQ